MDIWIWRSFAMLYGIKRQKSEMQHKPKVGEVISIEEDEYLAPVNEVDDNKMDYE